MSRSYGYSVTLTLPRYGVVTADVQYYVGFAGSYWEPPDSDEVTVENVKDESGSPITLLDEEWEEFYELFLEAGGIAHSNHMNEQFNKYAEEWNEREDELNLPF